MGNFTKLSIFSVAVLSLAACGKQEQSVSTSQSGESAVAHIEATDSTIIKIGHIAPLTGPVSHLGKDGELGAQLAIDDLNTSGIEIGGKKISFKLVSEDDQSDPKVATQVAQRMVDEEVVSIVGHLNSGTSIPASKIYADAGIPQISPAATNPEYTNQGFKTTFRVVANDVQQGGALGQFAVEGLKAKKVAIIDDRTAYGQGLADEFEKAIKAKGASVTKREFTTSSATDFSAILTSIKASQPDVVFYGGVDAQAGPMAKQMKRLGISAKLMGGDSMQSPEFIKLAGDAAEGQYASTCGIPRDKMPGFAEFEKKFKAKFNADVQVYAPYAYDAVRVLADSMKRAGSTDPKKYLSEVGKTNYSGVTGKIAFDNKGDIKNGAVTVYQVKNGKWEVVSTVGGNSTAGTP